MITKVKPDSPPASVESNMKIPLYWSKATATEPQERGGPVTISRYRSSDISPEDAKESALAAARKAIQRFNSDEPLDRYPYSSGDVPVREEVIQRFEDSQGGLYAAVTRNAYGSLVLNAAHAMFIDIDFPGPPNLSPWETLKTLCALLFGKKTPTPVGHEEEDAKGRLDRLVIERPGWSVRVYRTFAGVRALVTHELFEPASDISLATLGSVGADPLYVRLCKAQACFRARLTPKPWRCGHFGNNVTWPIEGEERQQNFAEWLAAYTSKQSQFATCRYLGTLGSNVVHPDIETIVEVHDKITRCHEPMPLA
jgi:hypothetical protein